MDTRRQLQILLWCWSFSFGLHDALTHAAQPDAQVDRQEILRLGDLVQHVGDGHAAPGEQEFLVAMALPADDNHKWFISVIGSRNCPHCATLKKDFAANEHLRALVNVEKHEQSWAHFNWYDVGDKSQAWRWEGIKLAGYPTILVQPPLNKKHGDAATVVMQHTGYDGDGRKLASKITATIRAYLAKRAQANAGPAPTAVGIRRFEPPAAEEPPAKTGGQKTGGHRQFTPAPGFEGDAIGVDPPWTPPPKNDPVAPPSIPAGPLAFPVDFIPTIPPVETPPAKPQPKPTPGPTPEKPAKPATEPEVLVITEGTAGANDSRVGLLLAAVRDRHSGRLRERILDWRDAPDGLNVKREDLPTVVVTDADGHVVERLGGRLLPLLDPPKTTPEVTIWDFPFAALLSLFTGGASVAGFAAIGLWAVRWIRARRQAKAADAASDPQTTRPPAPILPQAQFDQLLANLPALIELIAEKFKKPAPPAA